MDAELLVRDFDPEDAASVTHLLHAAYAEHAAAGWNFTAADQDIATTLSRAAAGQTWVVLQDNLVVATLTVTMPPAADLQQLTSLARSAHRAWLTEIAVAPTHRGRGIASALWQLGATWAQDQGADSIGIDTTSKALHLVELFQQWGFIAADVISAPGKTYRSVVMMHDLPRADSSSPLEP